MENLDTKSSPNKRQKTETLIPESPITPSLNKGKAPIITSDDDTPPQESCGICLSDQGKTVRGFIDSCHHYFCFKCIIEWSKIDSRCPLCRGRFTSIRRMRKDGTFIGIGSVAIPVRDQIYDAFGEPVDPYGEAKCSVCNGTKDECLLLLCDLCDSASHTYCVGLGATVPEDDWYCHDCDLLRAEQSDSETGDDAEASPLLKGDDKLGVHCDNSDSAEPVSIFDIVREPEDPRKANSGTDRLLKLVSSNPTKFSSSAIVSNHPNSSSSSKPRGTSDNLISLSNNRESSARTLRKSREFHKNLSVLRDNWDSFRAGSLSFSANLFVPSDKVSRKMTEVKTVKQSCQSQSTKFSQSKAREILCDTTPKEPSYNVQRAWKLMSAAKSLQPANKAKSCSSAPKSALNLKGSNTSTVSKHVLSGKKDVICRNVATQNLMKKVNGSLAQSSVKHSSPHVPRLCTASEVQTKVKADSYCNGPSLASCGPSSHCDVSCTSSQGQRTSTIPEKQVGNFCSVDSKDEEEKFLRSDFRYQRASLATRADVSSSSLKISSDPHISDRPAFPPEMVACDGEVSFNKSKEKEVSKCRRSNGDKMTKKASKDGEAKGEILSLVKLNLKLLSKEKRLESETYKEIARISTHTILASCGLEHRDIVPSIPTLVCHHANQIQRLPRCALVPSSCRDCFYTFVKDVVNSILSEKTKTDAVAC